MTTVAYSRVLVLVALAVLLAAVSCAPAAAPQPTAAPAPKPAAQPTAAAAAPTTAPVAPTAVQAAPAAKAAVELRAGSSYAENDIHTIGMDKFAQLVNEKSKGQINVRVFYTSLGAEQQLTESVMSGSVDVGMISNGNAGRYTNAYFIYDLPFLFRNYDNMLKAKDAASGQQLTAQFEKDLNVKALFITSAGSGRDIQTRNKQVKTPADLKGMKIRVVSTPIDLATFKAWGANPTPVDWGQTVTALQQGVVDGMAVATVFLLTSKSYEPIKYNTHVEYQPIFEEVFINGKKFASLTPDQQKILVDAGREAGHWQHQEAAKQATTATQDLAKLGVTTYQPTPAELDQWASIRDSVWQDVADQLKDKIDFNLAKQIAQSQ